MKTAAHRLAIHARPKESRIQLPKRLVLAELLEEHQVEGRVCGSATGERAGAACGDRPGRRRTDDVTGAVLVDEHVEVAGRVGGVDELRGEREWAGGALGRGAFSPSPAYTGMADS